MQLSGFKAKPLKDQRLVITGASSGIGLATARMAAERGAQVLLSSRNEEELRKCAERINAGGGKAAFFKADVGNFEEVEALKNEALRLFGGFDTWINNAGVSIFSPLMDSTLEEERKVFETNFWGVRHGCRVAVPVLARNGGVIINIGSEVSEAAVPLQGIYSASKHAVKAYTDALRMEIEKGHLPVALCLVRPAAIDTPFTDHAVNRLPEGEPSLPAPVYHPDVAARAIIDCAESPQRDVFVGGASKFFAFLEHNFPRVTDLFMEAKQFEAQSRGSKVPHESRQEALFHPPAKEGFERGSHRGHVMRTSLYTQLSQHPWQSLAFTGFAAGIVGGLLSASKKSAARQP